MSDKIHKTDKMGHIMSSYANVGAWLLPGYSDVKTKAALKRLFAEKPESVTLYSTDAFGENVGKEWKPDNLDKSVKYSVTGPNPYNSRKWYATVEFNPKTDKWVVK